MSVRSLSLSNIKEQLQDLITSMLRPLRNRVYMMISRVVIEATKDNEGMQTLKLSALADEERDDIERFQNYGFTSVPKEGAEGIVICPQGNREHMIVIVVDDRRFRFKAMAEGEVAMYTDEGDAIHIKRGGNIEILAAATVKVKSPVVELGETATEALVKGDIFKTLFNSHTHIGSAPGNLTTGPVQSMGPVHLSTISKTE